jgi:hypothetical protein
VGKSRLKMSGPGTGHVRQGLLEPGTRVGYARLIGGNRGGLDIFRLGPDMFDKGLWNLIRRSDMFGFFW